ncbi:hypothetical protein SKAU_G00072550 [Synaphobranchus kaupii]|uniref:Uncharacterized protein n=1 Tax=Synaphobranchus kaupii TaxID=118154 RepID=A0A9Q1G778_SYNKA|nr:hypothetical protein SKAU_G00072550 [Synaphobranchus kaupii]
MDRLAGVCARRLQALQAHAHAADKEETPYPMQMNGWPRMIPVLEPVYVAKKVVRAILTDQVYLLLPKSMYFIAGLKKTTCLTLLSWP